jgi:hypothetical protein
MPFQKRGAPTKYATGQRRERGKMNRVEQAYSHHLDDLMARGEVLWYAFDCVTLQIGENCRYTVDFMVMASDGTMEVHDVKGRKMKKDSNDQPVESFWGEEDAIIKLKMVAQEYPLPVFIVFPLKMGGWVKHEMKRGPTIRSM